MPFVHRRVGMSGAANDRALRTAVLVGLATMAVAAFGVAARTTYGAQTSSDEPQYLITALSIAEDFDLDISDELERRAFEPFHEISLDTQTFDLDESGQRISPHDPLLPIVAAPAMWVGGWVGVRILLVVVGGLVAGVTTWTAIRRFGVSVGAGAAGVGSLMVSAPIAAYSTQVFPEIMAALSVCGVVAAATAPRLGPRHVAVVVVGLIALPWLSIKYAPVAAVLGAAALWPLLRDRRTAALWWTGGVLAAAAALYLVVHQRVYGGWTVYSTGDHFVDDGEFAVIGADPDYVGRSRRLTGLLVDRRFGLVPWAPVWALAPFAVAWYAAAGQRRMLLLGPVVAGWLVATFVALTMHGWWSPGRQVVVIVPLVAIALAVLVDRHRPLRWVAGALGLVGAANWMWLAVEATTDRRTIIVDFYETAAVGYRAIEWAFVQGWPVTSSSDAVLAVWTVVIALSMVAGVLVGVRDRPGSGQPPDEGERSWAPESDGAREPAATAAT